MNDIGLKSYQDIREPEYETDERCSIPLYEWTFERDRCLELIFAHVLMLQRDLEIQLWFDWSPHVSAVYVSTYGPDATWHSGEENQIIFIVNEDYVNEDMDPGEWAARVIDKLDRWADKFYEEHSV